MSYPLLDSFGTPSVLPCGAGGVKAEFFARLETAVKDSGRPPPPQGRDAHILYNRMSAAASWIARTLTLYRSTIDIQCVLRRYLLARSTTYVGRLYSKTKCASTHKKRGVHRCVHGTAQTCARASKSLPILLSIWSRLLHVQQANR